MISCVRCMKPKLIRSAPPSMKQRSVPQPKHVRKVEVELAVSRAKMMSQIGAVLTADQKAQLAARRQERRPPHRLLENNDQSVNRKP